MQRRRVHTATHSLCGCRFCARRRCCAATTLPPSPCTQAATELAWLAHFVSAGAVARPAAAPHPSCFVWVGGGTVVARGHQRRMGAHAAKTCHSCAKPATQHPPTPACSNAEPPTMRHQCVSPGARSAGAACPARCLAQPGSGATPAAAAAPPPEAAARPRLCARAHWNAGRCTLQPRPRLPSEAVHTGLQA